MRRIKQTLLQKCTRPFRAMDLFFLALLTLCFFTLPIFIAPDSTTYLHNAQVLAGQHPLSSWDSVRGPLLPLLLRISFALFGESATGTAVMFFITYCCLIAATLYLGKLLGLTEMIGRLGCWVLCTVFIFLSPTVLTYSHYVLTEFFALVLTLLAFCLTLRTQQLLLGSSKRRWLILAIRYLGLLFFTVAAYALKQMFFAFVLVPFFISEAYVLAANFKIKQIATSLMALLLLCGSVFGWAGLWASWIAHYAPVPEAFDASSMSSSMLIDGMRYFRPEERGTTNQEIRIDITANDTEQTIGSFTYHFTGSFGNSLQFLATCFAHSPERFLSSYINNYFIICNVRRPLNYGSSRSHTSVSSTNQFFESFETYAWMEKLKDMQAGQSSYAQPNPEGMAQFEQPVDSGLISNLLFNTAFPKLSYFLYSFPAFCALPLFALGLFFSVLRRKNEKKSSFWGNVTLLAGSIFGSLLFLAITASNIDRYGFPATIWCALLLAMVVVFALQHLSKRFRAA